MTTYNKISEQIQRLYARQYDRENLMPNIDKREIRLLAIQVINELVAATLKDAQRIGDVNIMSSVIAKYPSQPVTVVSPNYTLTNVIEGVVAGQAQYPLLAPSSWTDSGSPWTSKTGTTFNASGAGSTNPDFISYQPLVVPLGATITFSVTVAITSGVTTNFFYLADANKNQIGSVFSCNTAGTYTVTLTNTSSISSSFIGFDSNHSVGTFNYSITLNGIGTTIIYPPFPQVLGAVTTSGSNTITFTSLSNTVAIGNSISGTNIPAGTTITSANSSQIIISQPATGNGTGLTLNVLTNCVYYQTNFDVSIGDTLLLPNLSAGTTVSSVISPNFALLSSNFAGQAYLYNQTFIGVPAAPSILPSYTAKLPVFPIRLPFDIGVWSILLDPFEVQCIPVPSAINDLVGGLSEGMLENQIGYTVEGRLVKFIGSNALLQNAFSGTPTVTMKLLIVDPQLLNDDDPLPIPPEYEDTVIQKVLALFNSVKLEVKENG